MIALAAPELSRLATFLQKYDPKSTVAQLAGLLTVPALLANTLRIETLVHLAVAQCHGRRRAGHTEIGNWLNRQLGNTEVAQLEDPSEDVFVTNVETREGNRRIFDGIWEANDYFVQVLVDTLDDPDVPPECRALLVPIQALLRLSDCVAERLGLGRWVSEASTSKGTMRIAPALRLADRARAVTFSQQQLESLGVSRDDLGPFLLDEHARGALMRETVGHSSLERYPLVDYGGDLVMALPHAVSPAIRRFVLSMLRQTGYLRAFESAIGNRQARQLQDDILWELKGEAESLKPPETDERVPSLHGWLLKYDMDKYLHVVLLHDRLDWLEEQGLSSFLKYPEPLRVALERYLGKVAEHCRALPDFATGVTLLVLGGLGRGFALGFNDWPDSWCLSAIRISDALMLAGELDQPITRYLKLAKHKEWAEDQGVHFHNVNGDFNFYCHWRRMNSQLVPRELPVADDSMLAIPPDMLQPVRANLRRFMDRHTIQTVDGQYSRVTRFGRDIYFESMQVRPIYASLDHLRTGVLAGAAETRRGPSWLLVLPRTGDEQMQRLLYEMWTGFLGLYDCLVFEVEAFCSQAPLGPVEMRLNFGDLISPEGGGKQLPAATTNRPAVVFDFGRRAAEVMFPWDFLANFQQPDNSGERLVLYGLAKGLVGLHQGPAVPVDDSIVEEIVSRVAGDSGMRVLHLFRTYHPIDHLLAQRAPKPIFLAHEDFVFSKLRLSYGFTGVASASTLTSKQECNDFLHKVVQKVWSQLREILQGLDRASVIREALLVHEGALQDRSHWSRTSQALFALYASTDDVVAVAQTREQDRNNVSLAARTILEMAICECPVHGGRRLSRWGMDNLLAKAALLLEVATDSDAINCGLTLPRIELHPNGEYTINRQFQKTVIRPFLEAYFAEELEEAAGKYAELYRIEPNRDRVFAKDVFSSNFNSAFHAEFGLTPDQAVDGVGELMELAVERNAVVVESTLGDLRARLTDARELAPEVSDAFIRTFSIFHRPAWDKPPAGLRNREINPWRFRRRLSATAKPMFVFGVQDHDAVFYGAGGLRRGFAYLLHRAEEGHLPQEFFTSGQMKRYIGAVNDERGHEFARSVADQLRGCGWAARNEVQMTELGGSAGLGDVDVLAWKPTGEIWIIECKRLQLARTVAEIAEICGRFKGEANDELDKHVQRLNWIRANPAALQRIVGFPPDVARIDDRLVTNTHVPMMYLTSLPIRPDKIGPLKL